MSKDILVSRQAELVKASGVPRYLDCIRPHWQSKSLIERVRRLLTVDPSSACQRLLNAAIHDLKEKIVIAGVDIATEAASQNKLPPVNSGEDLENYSNHNVINLAYRMGLLSRPEWKRVTRCYEIRRDLEHEDDEYEATPEDCMYIFSTCCEVILSRDPITLVKVEDFKDIIEEASAVAPNPVILEDYENAPDMRQEEILKFLLSNALDKKKSDIVQQNAYHCIGYLKTKSKKAVLTKVGEYLQNKAGREIDERTARVANAAGLFPYLRQAARKGFYQSILDDMERTGWDWQSHAFHGDLLRGFIDVGGLDNCPEELKKPILKWLVKTYVGEPGGLTRFGHVRHVYYSNVASPLIAQIVSNSSWIQVAVFEDLRDDSDIQILLKNEHLARRYEKLVDCVNDS